ncbi:hypothetical protein EUGRSUZ_G01924 [Eucalyptus grandis]|uniref:Uncharacterized protein n=2 Tax=Eucalyptus grandis TaxID=71139 RepID=A0A059BDJ3_EUCGR|nr:hypothetical protein EUGRSUZ_G01924 [Eucalyptus grandis]
MRWRDWWRDRWRHRWWHWRLWAWLWGRLGWLGPRWLGWFGWLRPRRPGWFRPRPRSWPWNRVKARLETAEIVHGASGSADPGMERLGALVDAPDQLEVATKEARHARVVAIADALALGTARTCAQ